MIAVIDYNMGNVGSILNMLRKLGFEAKLTRDREELLAAGGLILPGVGAFDRGMSNLRDLGLLGTLNECVLERHIPFLGICLGMQLLTGMSEEGMLPGLGWIAGETKRFNFSGQAQAQRVPHMGWNQIHVRPSAGGTGLARELFAGTEAPQRYYFVHSYHVCCPNQDEVLATAVYGDEFIAAIGRDNIAGTQFHPEKSHRYGLKLMDNFGRYVTQGRTEPLAESV